MKRAMQINTSQYVVKDILQYKKDGRKEYFLIWWENFPKNEATWEPIQNVSEVSDFQLYYRRLKSQYLQKKKKTVSKNVSSIDSSQIAKESLYQRQQSKQRLAESQQYAISKNFCYFLPYKDKKNERVIQNKVQQYLQQGKYLCKLAQLNSKDKPNKEQNQDFERLASKLIKPDAEVAEDIPEKQWIDKKNTKKSFRKYEQNDSKQDSVQESLKRSQRWKFGSKEKRGQSLQKNTNRSKFKKAKFEIRIPQYKSLLFQDNEIIRIKDAYLKGDKRFYEVEFNATGFKEPVVLHQDYLKTLWPRKFAEYLLSKLRIEE